MIFNTINNQTLPNLDIKPFMEVGIDDIHTTNIVGFGKDYNKIYMIDARDQNTAGLFELDINTMDKKLIYQNDKCDVDGMLQNHDSKAIEGYSYTYDKTEWIITDPKIEKIIDSVKQQYPNDEIIFNSRNLDQDKFIVVIASDVKSAQYLFVDTANDIKIDYLFSNNPKLDEYTLQPMHPVIIQSRDGLDLMSYLTLPAGRTWENNQIQGEHAPLVLYVHGGPTARDEWGLNKIHQWLANRGYAVLSVNYRGSTGFGKDFINISYGEWSKKMHDDLIDSVKWAIDNKITTSDKVGIFGGSYGGYATLVGLTFTPDVFACGVDIVGPSNLVTLLESVPPYWKPMIVDLEKKLGGDLQSDEGKAALLERSPITYVDNIKKPLLIAQGANDPRVKKAESDQIVAAMQEKKIPVTYILYPDEGHGWARPENNKSSNAIIEYFFHHNLGGIFEPFNKSDFDKSSMHISSDDQDLYKAIEQFYDGVIPQPTIH